MSDWGKILFFVVIFMVVVALMNFFVPKNKNRTGIEGFTQKAQFESKESVIDIYDDFYANIYDHLVFSYIKNEYEIGEIIEKTHLTEESRVLDIGSGTGHHVGSLLERRITAEGIDLSPNMVAKSKTNYPGATFTLGDIMNKEAFAIGQFTHITCLYFTIYYLKDKPLFFRNCISFLKPGGYLIIHLVNRDKFDPVLPAGNPLVSISPQKYAKERVTTTKIAFNDFAYDADFIMGSSDCSTFVEKFKNTETGHTRKHEHNYYMETQEMILTQAQNEGFILDSKIELLNVSYEYQYLYVLVKPF